MTRLQGKFRGYALDFWGFGDSGKHLDSFKISDFVDLVDQFMDRLGIESAPIIGHSMGGTVALSLALKRPEKVEQVVIIGSPISGDSLTIWFQLCGQPQIATLLRKFPFILKAFLYYIKISSFNNGVSSQTSEMWYQMAIQDVSATTRDSFFSSIRSLHQTDLTPRLAEIKIPTLGIYGMGDIIVDPGQSKLLNQYVPNSQVVLMPGSGHFPMLDEPDLFHQHLLDFLDQGKPRRK
jgi:pimeloyl-ACP methyl ester carboxylesterase